MIKKLKQNKYKILLIFQLTLVIFSLISRVLVPVNSLIGTSLNVILVLFAIIVVLLFINDRAIFKFKYFKLILLFFISVIFSIFLNISNNFINNIQILFFLFVELFICFPAYIKNKKTLLNHINYFFNIISLAIFVVSLISFILFCSKIEIYYWENRYSGIFSNPNTTSIISLLGLLLSTYVIFNKKSIKFTKLFHFINIIVSATMFYLAKSNSGVVELAILIISSIYIHLFYNAKKPKKFVKKSIICTICCILVLFVLLYSNSLLFNKLFNSIFRIEKGKGLDNNRFEIWRQGLQIFIEKPLFGYSPANVSMAIYKEFGNNAISGYMHNIFIELLVASGIISFVIFVIFVYKIFIYINNHIFKLKIKNNRNLCVSLFLLLLVIVVFNFTNSSILFSADPMAFIFWICLGYLINFFILDDKKDNKLKKVS